MTQAQLESKIQSAIEKTVQKIAIPAMQIDHRYRAIKQKVLSDVEDFTFVTTAFGLKYEEDAVLASYNNAVFSFKEEIQPLLEEIYRELSLESM